MTRLERIERLTELLALLEKERTDVPEHWALTEWLVLKVKKEITLEKVRFS